MARIDASTNAVMDALGGNSPVAKITKRQSSKVPANWRRFETFPPDTYLAMTSALRLLGHEPPHHALWRMIDPVETLPQE